jgi:hypothetical protein
MARPEGRVGGARCEGLVQRRVAAPAPRGLTFKKTPFALEQARDDIARRRRRWRARQDRIDPRRLVFIDETWIKTKMAPLRGWGAKGKRLRGFAPYGHWRALTFLGAPALGPSRRALRLRRPDQRRMLPRLCRTATRAGSAQGRPKATSSSWTISAAINPQPSDASSARPARGSGISRHIRPISTRSSKPLP